MGNYFVTKTGGNQWLFGAEADMPSAGEAGRFYYTTDTKKIFYDSGTSWVQIPAQLPILEADMDLNSHNLLNPGNLIVLPISTDIDMNGYKLLNPGNLIVLPISADIDMNGYKLTNLANPTDVGDAATKGYVDSAAGGGYQSGFMATMSSDSSLGSGSYNKLTFNTELLDGLGEYDNSTNYRFTAQSAGRYLFNITASVQAGASDIEFDLEIWKNGSQYKKSIANFAGNYGGTVSIEILVELSANDYIEAYCESSADVTVFANSYFSGQRVY